MASPGPSVLPFFAPWDSFDGGVFGGPAFRASVLISYIAAALGQRVLPCVAGRFWPLFLLLPHLFPLVVLIGGPWSSSVPSLLPCLPQGFFLLDL